MAYTYFDGTKPVDTDTGPVVVQTIRDNFNSAMDQMLTFGWIRYNVSNTYDGNGNVTQSVMTNVQNSNDKIRVNYTYDANSNVTVSEYRRSTNGGSTWDNIGKHTYTYDSNDNMTAATWSDTI